MQPVVNELEILLGTRLFKPQTNVEHILCECVCECDLDSSDFTLHMLSVGHIAHRLWKDSQTNLLPSSAKHNDGRKRNTEKQKRIITQQLPSSNHPSPPTPIDNIQNLRHAWWVNPDLQNITLWITRWICSGGDFNPHQIMKYSVIHFKIGSKYIIHYILLFFSLYYIVFGQS